MNAPALDVEEHLEGLRGLPFVRRVQLEDPPGPRGEGEAVHADAEVHIETPDGTRRLLALAKHTHLDRATARALLAALGENARRWILFAPHVGRPLGGKLRAGGLNYVDRNGNCYLRVDDHYVAQIEGRTGARIEKKPKAARAAGARVLFALLAEEELLARPIRDVAEAAGAGRTATMGMVDRLVEAGAIVKAGRRRNWLPGGRRTALDLWIGNYGTVLRPALYVGRYRTPDRTPEDLDTTLVGRLGQAEDCWYGGVAAGYRVVQHYRGATTVLHLDGGTAKLARRLRALPDPQGPVVLLGLPGPLAKRGVTPDTVHPLLVYAEMLQGDDERAAEAAELFRKRALAEFA